jgi:hypothetical protein
LGIGFIDIFSVHEMTKYKNSENDLRGSAGRSCFIASTVVIFLKLIDYSKLESGIIKKSNVFIFRKY